MAGFPGIVAPPSSVVLLERVAVWFSASDRGSRTFPTIDVERLSRIELCLTSVAGHFGEQIARALWETSKVDTGPDVDGILEALDLSRADYSEIARFAVQSGRILSLDIARVIRMIIARR